MSDLQYGTPVHNSRPRIGATYPHLELPTPTYTTLPISFPSDQSMTSKIKLLSPILRKRTLTSKCIIVKIFFTSFTQQTLYREPQKNMYKKRYKCIKLLPFPSVGPPIKRNETSTLSANTLEPFPFPSCQHLSCYTHESPILAPFLLRACTAKNSRTHSNFLTSAL